MSSSGTQKEEWTEPVATPTMAETPTPNLTKPKLSMTNCSLALFKTLLTTGGLVRPNTYFPQEADCSKALEAWILNTLHEVRLGKLGEVKCLMLFATIMTSEIACLKAAKNPTPVKEMLKNQTQLKMLLDGLVGGGISMSELSGIYPHLGIPQKWLEETQYTGFLEWPPAVIQDLVLSPVVRWLTTVAPMDVPPKVEPHLKPELNAHC